MFKETDGSFYIISVYPEALEQNKNNIYEVITDFLSNDNLKSSQKGEMLKPGTINFSIMNRIKPFE